MIHCGEDRERAHWGKSPAWDCRDSGIHTPQIIQSMDDEQAWEWIALARQLEECARLSLVERLHRAEVTREELIPIKCKGSTVEGTTI